MAAIIHVGDQQTAFRLTVRDQAGVIVDLSAATVLQILFRKPNNATVVKAAQLVGDGKDGRIYYATSGNDLDQPGHWQWQGYVVTPSWSGHTTINKFTVEANL